MSVEGGQVGCEGGTVLCGLPLRQLPLWFVFGDRVLLRMLLNPSSSCLHLLSIEKRGLCLCAWLQLPLPAIFPESNALHTAQEFPSSWPEDPSTTVPSDPRAAARGHLPALSTPGLQSSQGPPPSSEHHPRL